MEVTLNKIQFHGLFLNPFLLIVIAFIAFILSMLVKIAIVKIEMWKLRKQISHLRSLLERARE